ncbi:restriction endonuclease subunit S [Acinetobacter junii]|nr:restriction endonuclease subunit S [Acinetobacter junii]
MTNVKQLITEHLDIWLTAETEKKSGRGRSSGSNDTIYGVQKLRELILELAVTGKLTVQNKNDCSEKLLESLLSERADLIKQKKIRNSKLKLIDKSKFAVAIPSNWAVCSLGSIAKKLTDGSHNPPVNNGSGYPMLSSQNINGSKIDFDNPSRFVDQIRFDQENTRTDIQSGDVLLTIVGTLGRSAVVPETAPKFVLQRSVAVIQTSINPYYLSLFFHSPLCINYFLENGKGTAQKGIYLNKLSELPLTLPPLEEQHRIVEKVDELMQLCDQLEQQQTLSGDAHATLVDTLLKALTESSDADEFQGNWQRIVENFDVLFTTEYSIEQLKQTVLQLAVMGKLVKQDPSDEPASELLKKIADEKAKLIKDGMLKKRSKKYSLPILDLDFSSNWSLVNLDQIIWNLDAGWSPACHPYPAKEDKWGVLKTTFVQCNYFIKDENKELPEELDPRIEAELKSGDILVTRAGPYNRVGVACYVDKIRPKLMISDKLIRISYSQHNLYGAFIALAINLGISRDYLKDNQSGMAESQVNISQEKLREAPFLLPPLNEQKRIVEKVNQLFSIIEQLQVLQSKLQKTKLHLADALVANAVEGV